MDPVAVVEVNVPVALRTPRNLNFTTESCRTRVTLLKTELLKSFDVTVLTNVGTCSRKFTLTSPLPLKQANGEF